MKRAYLIFNSKSKKVIFFDTEARNYLDTKAKEAKGALIYNVAVSDSVTEKLEAEIKAKKPVFCVETPEQAKKLKGHILTISGNTLEEMTFAAVIEPENLEA